MTATLEVQIIGEHMERDLNHIHLLQVEVAPQGGAYFGMQGTKYGGYVRRTNFCADDTDHQAIVVPAV